MFIFSKKLPVFKMGLKVQPTDDRDFLFSTKSKLGSPTDENATIIHDLEQYIDDIYYQTSGSCVAQSCAMGVQIREIASDMIYEKASVYFIYNLARLKESSILEDEGSQPRLAFKSLQDYGVPNEFFFPETKKNLSRQPNCNAFIQAFNRRLGRYESILSNRKNTGSLIELAINKKLPVLGGFAVGKEWMSYNGSDLLHNPQDSIGNHMITIIGYGDDYYKFVNSWGEKWGNHGFGYLSKDYVEKHSFNLTVFDGWKKIQSKE